MSLLSIVVSINTVWVALVHHLIWNTQTYALNLATRVGMNQAKHEDDIEALTTKVATLTEALNKANHVSDVLAQELDNTNQALEESRNEQAMTALQLNQLLGKLDSLQEQVTTLRKQRDNETFMVTVSTHDGYVSKHQFCKNLKSFNLYIDGSIPTIPSEISQLHNLKTLTTNCNSAEEFVNNSVITLMWEQATTHMQYPIWKCFPNLETLNIVIRNTLADTNKLIDWLKQYPCKIKTLTIPKRWCDGALLEYHCDKLNIKVIDM